jgi:hypothetical protein
MSTIQVKERPSSFDEAAAIDLLGGWSFLDDEHFDALFLDCGFAIAFAARITCRPNQPYEMEFASDHVDLHERDAGEEPQHYCSLVTGEAFWSNSPGELVVEAASVVGPIRFTQDHSVNEQMISGLEHLRELILEQIDEAVNAPDSVFRPSFTAWASEQLPTSEALLDRVVALYCENDDPKVQRVLEMLRTTKHSKLH